MDTRIAQHWDRVTQQQSTAMTRWWQNPAIVSHINRVVCGERLPGAHAGFHKLIAAAAKGAQIKRAVSIGCGNGAKEMVLLRSGLVEHFDLYELSGERIAQGEIAAAKAGLSSRVTYHQEDVFAADASQHSYDMVYWNNALHHMMDVVDAVFWSRLSLVKDGTLQWTTTLGQPGFSGLTLNSMWPAVLAP